MGYNIRKVTRECNRQYALQNSWEHIHSEISTFEKRNTRGSESQRAAFTVRWCRKELFYLRKLNAGFPKTKPERAVSLLMQRARGNKDPLAYNIQQLKIQCFSKLS